MDGEGSTKLDPFSGRRLVAVVHTNPCMGSLQSIGGAVFWADVGSLRTAGRLRF